MMEAKSPIAALTALAFPPEVQSLFGLEPAIARLAREVGRR